MSSDSQLLRGDNRNRYDSYIGSKIFYRGHVAEVIDQIMANPLTRQRIEVVAARQKKSKAEVKKAARKQAEYFVARQEYIRLIRFAAWSVGSMMHTIYDQGVWVDRTEIRRLRETARAAALKKQSILFLPCHRSHVDYVSLHIILFQLGLSLPSIVAGENLNFPLVGKFLQNCGAFWIARETPTEAVNPMYATLMTSYIDTLMERGQNFECFIEGGRSRTGKMLPPKYGMLKELCESLLRLDKDAIVVPVSVQYDNVLETETYANELLGRPKTKESLSSFVKARRVLALRMGRIDCRFAEGFSIRDYLRETGFMDPKDYPAATTEREMFAQNSTPILRRLGYSVLHDINQASVVMPTALIATVLLTLRGPGISKSNLVKRVQELSDLIRHKGGRVASIDNYETIVDKAISVLGKLVGIRTDLLEDTYFAADRFQISYFRNQIIHLFINEAVICVSLYTKVKAGGKASDQRISADDLQRQTLFLSRVMKGEFIWNTQGIEMNLQQATSQLSADGVINIGEGWIELSDQERLRGREMFDFYCFLLWPFVETYWFAGVCLLALTPLTPLSEPVLVKDYEKAVQLLGKTLFHQGDVSYITAVSSETLQNALQYYYSLGAITMVKGAKKKDLRIQLSPEWLPSHNEKGKIVPEGRLIEHVRQIGYSRKEGSRSGVRNTHLPNDLMRLVERLRVELHLKPAAAPLKAKL